MPVRRPATLLALLTACGAPGPAGDEADAGGDASTTTAGSTSTASSTSTAADPTTTAAAGTTTAGDSTGGSEPALTYYRDIKPILDARCATCHRAGDIAPFALTTYEEASTLAGVIRPAIEDRTMPPWPPDAACSSYERSLALTDDERTRALAWIDDGAPAGDPADQPPPPPGDDHPPVAYDIEASIPEPFTPTALPDDYRCFLIDWPKDQDVYATAFTVEPGARPIVHHVIAFLIPPDEVDPFVALDEADPGPGYPCYGGPGGEASPRARWLGFWVPGVAGGGELPEGTGIRVEPGSKIALQMHYHPLGTPMADQSTVKIRTATQVERPAYLLPLAHPGWMVDAPAMTIPAGAPDTVHAFTMDLNNVIAYLFDGNTLGVDTPLRIHAAGVHMHTRGVRASLHVQKGGMNDACLVDVPRWDFAWQGTYELSQPVDVDVGTPIRLECHFDNSLGDASLKWGEGTEDEMCLGMMYASAPGA